MANEVLSTKELINQLEGDGIIITRRKLVRWQNLGAIPRPIKRGLGKGVGSVSLYPTSTVNQIKTIFKYWDDKRSFDQTIFDLWLDGYSINTKLLFTKYMKLYKNEIKRFYHDEEGDIILSKKADDFSNGRLSTGRQLRRARKRIRKSYFPELLEVLLRVLAGKIRIETDEGSYLGVTKLQIDKLVQAIPRELKPLVDNQTKGFYSKILADLEYLTSIISLDHLASLLENSTDTDLKNSYYYYKKGVDKLKTIPIVTGIISPLIINDVRLDIFLTLIALSIKNDPEMQARLSTY